MSCFGNFLLDSISCSFYDYSAGIPQEVSSEISLSGILKIPPEVPPQVSSDIPQDFHLILIGSFLMTFLQELLLGFLELFRLEFFMELLLGDLVLTISSSEIPPENSFTGFGIPSGVPLGFFLD